MSNDEKIFMALVDAGIFEISEKGQIYRVKKTHKEWKGKFRDCKPKLLDPKAHNGYIRLTVRVDKINIHVMGHRAVYIHFKGDIPEGYEINHKNGIRDDNEPNNLETVTKSENQLHAVNVLGRKTGNRTRGIKRSIVSAKKLDLNKVKQIRKLFKDGLSYKDIAKQFNVTSSLISQIISGKIWNTGGKYV